MLWLIYLLIFGTVFFGALAIAQLLASKKEVRTRLEKIRGMETTEEDVLRKPFTERLVEPFFQRLGNGLANLTPKEIRNRVEQNITYAGRPWNLTFTTFIALQAVLATVFAALTLLVFSLLNAGGGRTLLLVLIMAILGIFLPYFILSSKAQVRQKEIQKSLPDMMDLLLVSVEAGLGFDMALKRVADTMPGVLSLEIKNALEEIRLGRSRNEALRNIVRRTGVADLSSFVGAIIQSEELGSNIAQTLRIQADSLRQKRRQRAEEQAMKAPIKMLFPLIFFIFPTLFIVILGPALIQILDMFANF